MRTRSKLKALVAAFALAFSLVAITAVRAVQPAEAATSCPPTVLIGVHGTNEETGVIGQELSALYNGVVGRTGLPEQGLTGWQDDSTLLTDLAAVLAGKMQFSTAIGKLTTAVNNGVTDLRTQIEGELNNCPGEHFVLAGFSQGAMVVHEFAYGNPGLASDVSGIVLWADPLFDGSDWPSHGAVDGTNNFTSSSGWTGITGYLTIPSNPWSGKVLSYCVSDDPVCNFNVNAQGTMALELAAQDHGHENKTPAIMTASENAVDAEGSGWAPSVYDDGSATFYTTWQDDGGVNGYLGQPSSDPVSKPGGGLVQSFDGTACGSSYGSAVMWSPSTGTHTMGGCIYNTFLAKYGGPGGTYGYPTSNEQATAGGTGRVNYMSGTPCGSTTGSGLFNSAATGTWPVHGCIFQKYVSIGEDKSGLGLPTSDEYSVSGGVEQNYSNGNIRDIGGSIAVNIDNSGSALDNTDPYATGCVSSAHPQSAVLSTTDGPTVITLEWSGYCGTNWTQVTPNTGNGNGSIEMNIWVERKNSNGSITQGDQFEFPPNGSTIAWSDQLYAPTQPARACEQYWFRATKQWSTPVCTAWSA